MSENIKKFYAALATDGDLKAKLDALGSEEKSLTRDEFVAFANEVGFEFTIEELKEHESELSEDDLEKIIGGLAYYECNSSRSTNGL